MFIKRELAEQIIDDDDLLHRHGPKALGIEGTIEHIERLVQNDIPPTSPEIIFLALKIVQMGLIKKGEPK